MIRKKIRCIFLGLSLGLLSVSPYVYADVTASNGWVRALPPTQPNTAAFLTLTNSQPEAVTLTAVTTSVAEKSEFHSHKKQASGMMAMRQEKSITIPANGEFVFKPGSYHIMLMGLKQPLKPGQTIDLTLQDQEGKQYIVSLPVRTPMNEKKHQHHHH